MTRTDRDVRPTSGRRSIGRPLALALAALLGLAALPGQAQPQPQPPAQGEASPLADPPSRVARLSDVSGQVWLYNPDGNEWSPVDRNQPLTTGDRLATDNDGRAEITLGTTTLRLDASTEIEVVRLDDARYAVRLQGGSLAARLRNAQALAEFEIDTDEGRFRVQAVGRYRFDRAQQASDVTVYNGQALYENRNTALPVATGQHAQFWIDAAGVPQYAMAAPVRDAFAAWNDERDRSSERVVATRYVSPEMTGAEDLDRYGQWEQTPDYGPVWVPAAVPAGWAPYSSGHWAWVRPWGWTWVDDARWGFAPFHYGRWVYRRDVWCWAPGSYVARPVYAPALVAWVGAPRVGVSVAIGGAAPVGWFPLAPHEVYVPSYRTSLRYVREVNVTHVTNVTTITTIINNRNGEADRRDFANRHNEHAVTFVPAEVMVRRQAVAPAAARFRNDPQVRAFVSEGRPAPVLTAPPVAAPPVAARAAESRSRPPFVASVPGSFAGRPEGARPEAGHLEPGRPEAARPAPRVAPGLTAAPPNVAVTPPAGGTPGATTAAPNGGAPRIAPPGRPTAEAPGMPRAQTGRDAVALPVIVPQQVRGVPPSPVQRGAQGGETATRPGYPAREGHAPAETAALPRATPIPTAPVPNSGLPDASGSPRHEHGAAPRSGEVARGGEVARPAAARAPEAAAVAAPPPPAPQRPPSGEPKERYGEKNEKLQR